ncbi:Cyanate permease [Rubrobacter radiotolerans]|uniref:Cyanate permease n=1 Tax=Rubrobacter radiotolerans TaxID=42256 RepID=A0A023X502_RUBRA|nr:MFS transporter [Rubrobacter radiotolerans]AHY47428.1 Cyanate permease [Rubrobacter radiotolerans]MDX5894831.1 MFS transporter [Rubrobacter radiotolerans]SMC06854.1 MFS transporter, CP family, cyanate transporter [Rubrobacter radiotolerans DSM 5868]
MKNGGRATLLLAAILLTALNLRTALASVSPVYTFIQEDLGIGRAAAGLVVTLPVLCMALFAPLATLVGHRLGRRAMILFSVALIGAATALRIEGGLFTLFASALAVGVGIAAIQALMPEVIKQSFPERSATINGAYTSSMALGATVAALAVVPLTQLSGWPAALSVWSVLALPALLAWLALGGIEEVRAPGAADPLRERLPLRVPRVWMTMAFFAMTSLMYFSVLSWISQVYEDAGLSPSRAGVALSVFTGVQILSAFLVPTLANRFPDRRPVLVGVITTTVVALVLITTVPTAAPWTPFAWAALIGASQGALFPLALTLPLDNTRTPEMAGRLTSACFLAGYGVASLGPTTIGAIRDATGGFTTPLLILAAIACAQIVLTTRLTPNFYIEDG